MNSTDVEIFRSGLDDLKFYIDTRISEVNSRLDDMNTRMKNVESRLSEISYQVGIQSRDTNHLQTSVYWGFAIMAVVIALVGFVITLAPMFRDIYKDAKQARRDNILTAEKIQAMIDNSIAKAMHLSAHKKG